ncbi:MAG: hypothetical protein ACRDIC_01490 [bacterium]
MPESISRSQYVVTLARELLDDIELSRLSPEALLLKATRLARLVESPEETLQWLSFEMIGYSDSPALIRLGRLTGRLTNESKKWGHWGPLAEIETRLATCRLRLQALRVPDISYSVSSANPHEWVTGLAGAGLSTGTTAPVNTVITEAKSLSEEISRYASIRSKVLALLHGFVSNIYYERVFSGLTESIFERYKTKVDSLLASRCGDALQKVPAVYDRLAASDSDQEAVRHALTTCRTIIVAFADAIYPPSKTPIQGDGKTIEVGQEQYLNRIETYVRERVTSDSRRTKLRQSLANLNQRVNAAVHDEVTPQEAQALFLETYLLLGEILTLAEPPTAPSLAPEGAPPESAPQPAPPQEDTMARVIHEER